MKKLLIIDGNSILNRAYFGIRPLTNKDGLHTHAVYGMTNILLRHLEASHPDYAAVAFDLPAPTFRHKTYEGYKSNRHGMPEELAEQLPYAKECCAHLGFTVLAREGWEADDILGTYARMAKEEGIECAILTGDRDSLQLIDDTTHVLLATTGETVTMDRAAFTAKYGIPPEDFVDVKALMGDSSDCIPGVAGIGEKTALKLIAAHHTLEGVYDNLNSPDITKSVRSKLEAGKDSAYLSRDLARIRTDAPVPPLSEITYTGFDQSSLLNLFTKLEFSALIKRLDLTADTSSPAAEESPANQSAAPEISILEVTPDALTDSLKGSRIAIQYEIEDSILTLTASDGSSICIATAEKSAFAPFFTACGSRILTDDSKALYALCDEIGVPLPLVGDDLTLAAYVRDPADNSYALDKLSLSLLGKAAAPDSDAEKLPLMLNLMDALDAELKEQNAYDLYRNIELPLARVLRDMEREGFHVDLDGIKAFGEQLAVMIAQLEEEIYDLAGCTFNINSPKQLGEILFVKLAFPGFKKTKTGYSTSAEILEKLAPYHPIIRKILDYRQYSKLKSTYTDGLIKVADEKGVIHSSFNQTITATGRLSSTEPNLQNIPVRTELGIEMRRFFIAGNATTSAESRVLVDADYSQIELRLLAHISGDPTMIEAFKRGDDIHTITASQVFDVPIEEVTSELRKRAKAVNFGIVYGIGDFSLAQDIKVTKAEAARYIESYLAKYPKVAAYLHDVVADAKRDGYVTTLFGRRRYIPELSSGKKQLAAFGERVAMNSPIQGTAADIIKLAMINVARALREANLDAKLILQVHDELILDSAASCAAEAASILRREMENVIALSLPLTVDVQIAPTWYDAH
ncbi:MAG: DNA polymerase I [Clostridia bacterium]|nr:DNA polymerase I [Clostridia bacterium]